MENNENPMRGIRGAITVEKDSPEDILSATLLLFETLIEKNRLELNDITALLITVTPDLKSVFPAQALRQIEKYRFLPIMCSQEIAVDGAIERCIRLMVIAFCPGIKPHSVHHIYLRKAQNLRPDIVGEN